MSNVREVLERTPPPILYHYTTQQGLLGIINDKEIWATHTQYLNYVREFRHALDLAKEELSAMQNEPARNERERTCLAEMERALLPGMERINVCVCSFSEHGDVLSQWRAYGGSASGFAIGFSGDFLRKTATDYGWLVPVIYDEQDQRELVRTLLEDVLGENLKRSNEKPEGYSVLGGNLVDYLYRYAPILKHKSFKEECEWRIVTRPLIFVDDRFRYRTGTSMLIPYYRLPLGNEEALGIQEVIIGPTPYPEQSHRSINGLLLKNEFVTDAIPWRRNSAVTIKSSQIPYRTW